jgi:hypothetical protein
MNTFKVTFHETSMDPALQDADYYGIVVTRSEDWTQGSSAFLQEAYDNGAAGFFHFYGPRLVFTRSYSDDLPLFEDRDAGFTPESAIEQLAAELEECGANYCTTIANILRGKAE